MLTETPSLGSLPPVKLLFQQAVDWLVTHLPAERAVLLYDDQVRATHGVEVTGFWENAPLSLTLLQEVRKRGEPLHLADVRTTPYADNLSLLLNDVRSLICVPFWDPQGRLTGLLYADCRTQARLEKAQLDRALKLARALEQQLRAAVKGEALPASPFREIAAAPKAAPAPRPARPEPESRRPQANLPRPGGRAVALFFRSLATMFRAGLPIHDSLSLLGKEAEDPRMGAVSWELSRRVQRGQGLAEAMQATGVFSSFQVQMVAVGQRAGALDDLLTRIADYEEKNRHDRMRIQSALVYPTLVLTVSLVLLIVAPTYMMSHQFQLLRDLHLPLPWLSQVLWAGSRALCSPLGLLLLAGLYTQRRRVLKLPAFRKLLRHAAVLHFARVLALQLKAGLSVVDALPQAAAVVDDPALNAVIPAARQDILDGSSVAQALYATGFFPRAFCDMLTVAEEIGQVPRLMEWLADFYELELQAAFTSFVAMMEPLVMMALGIAAGVVMIATLLPLIKALQAF